MNSYIFTEFKMASITNIKKKKQVRFNDAIVVICEPYNIAQHLHQARKSNYYEKILDKIRLSNMLNPILSPTLRKRIYEQRFKF